MSRFEFRFQSREYSTREKYREHWLFPEFGESLRGLNKVEFEKTHRL
jgi:hypothetical protein